ncbi:calcium/proton exchanger [Desulfobulbus sp. AH-315-M07]|nr:calcium/proton exchanger [Desulfobulbus sp. AH-315-M07]
MRPQKKLAIIVLSVAPGLLAPVMAPSNQVLAFWTAALGIIPLAYILGLSTEGIAERTSAAIGGMVNATMANGTELIIGFFALRAGQTELLKASVTGSLIGQLLFVSGLSIFFGGLKHKRQTFSKVGVQSLTTLLMLSVFAFVLPSVLSRSDEALAKRLTVPFAVALLALYLASLAFSLVTHKKVIDHQAQAPEEQTPEEHEESGLPRESLKMNLVWLALCGAGISVLAEHLVGVVEHAATEMGMSMAFVGVFVVAIAGNAAENGCAVWLATKNKLNLALNITLGSSIQVALVVVPIFVLMGFAMGHPIDLVFSQMEIMAIGFGATAMLVISHDGETNWLEGFCLVTLYVILGVCFYQS